MMTRNTLALVLALLAPTAAVAQPADDAPDSESPAVESSASDTPPEDEAPAEAPPETAAGVVPKVLHRPVSSARADADVLIRAKVVGDWRLAAMVLRYRAVGETEFMSASLDRGRKGDWVVTVPGRVVRAVGFDYYIESTGTDGAVRQHFASAEAPHPVRVEGQSAADTQAEQLARYDGARSRVRVDGSMVAYGSVRRTTSAGGVDVVADTDRFSDRYWVGEAEWVYRTLGLLHDMRFGAGLMRAEWPSVDDTAETTAETPGLNYGYAEFNLEFHRWFSTGGRIILGANAESFTAGIGFIGRIGDIAGTHFAARYELVGDVGSKTDLRFHWTTVPRMPMSIGIEFTDWPVGDRDAANLSYTVGYELNDRWTLNARLGTANRSESLDGGFQGGLGAMIDF